MMKKFWLGLVCLLWGASVSAQATTITNGMLGQWDTTRVEDGIYELQLIAFPIGGDAVETTFSLLSSAVRLNGDISTLLLVTPPALP